MELLYLKNATAAKHRKVEQDLNLLDPSFTRIQYTALLKGFYGFHRPWESAVEAVLDTGLPGFFAPRKKLPYLEADLRYLGFASEALTAIPECPHLPALAGMAAALGSLYVVEGSSLGGRILRQHFSRHLHLPLDAGCRYFSGYGDQTGPMWSAFGELLATRPATENEAMLESACSTFDLLGDWLSNAIHTDAILPLTALGTRIEFT